MGVCRDVGAAVVAVHYRRSPGHPFPAAYDDSTELTNDRARRQNR
ncbi:alpha/beta hydrolase fold domain-containing protein [Streptomyces sp. NPDC001793]